MWFPKAIRSKAAIWGVIVLLGCQSEDAGSQEIRQQANNDLQRELEELTALSKAQNSFKQLSQKCKTVRSPQAKKRCETMEKRPHLFIPRPQSNHKPPPKPQQVLRSSYVSQLITTKPSEQPCRQGEDEEQCRKQRALATDNLSNSVAECFAIQSKKWRDECLFQLAEKRLLLKGRRYAESANLCSISGMYRSKCYEHLSIELTGVDANNWDIKQHLDNAKQIKEFWKKNDAALGTQLVALYWFYSIEKYYSRNVLNDSLFKALPKEAHPHIWSHMAYRIAISNQKKSLDEWKSILLAIYQGKKSLKLPQKKNMRPPIIIPQDYETEDKNTTIYMMNGRRIIGETVEEEILISLLEAALHSGSNQSWIDTGRASSNPTLQTIAKRARLPPDPNEASPPQ